MYSFTEKFLLASKLVKASVILARLNVLWQNIMTSNISQVYFPNVIYAVYF